MCRFSNNAIINNTKRHLLHDGCNRTNGARFPMTDRRPCDVFINHRGVDTKKSFAGLLFQCMSLVDVHCFLDTKIMKPGERLSYNIGRAIWSCKVGVAVFSPRYCESTYCLHELALMIEMKKKVIPIFYDVEPSQLRVKSTEICSSRNLQRYKRALKEARNIAGFTFDSSKQDWSEILRDASSAVIENLMEVEEDRPQSVSKPQPRSPTDA